MPINGLMLTLTTDERRVARVLEMLQSRHEIEVGEIQDRWLPLIIDVPDERGSRDVHAWLEKIPGVESVDVILVGIDHETSHCS